MHSKEVRPLLPLLALHFSSRRHTSTYSYEPGRYFCQSRYRPTFYFTHIYNSGYLTHTLVPVIDSFFSVLPVNGILRRSLLFQGRAQFSLAFKYLAMYSYFLIKISDQAGVIRICFISHYDPCEESDSLSDPTFAISRCPRCSCLMNTAYTYIVPRVASKLQIHLETVRPRGRNEKKYASPRFLRERDLLSLTAY